MLYEVITCHDPHVINPDNPPTNKFLRLNRFQQSQPSAGGFDETVDMNCLACHDKEGWTTSAHADSIEAADQVFLLGLRHRRIGEDHRLASYNFV